MIGAGNTPGGSMMQATGASGGGGMPTYSQMELPGKTSEVLKNHLLNKQQHSRGMADYPDAPPHYSNTPYNRLPTQGYHPATGPAPGYSGAPPNASNQGVFLLSLSVYFI